MFAGINPLALSPTALTSDVADFLNALSRGDLADAVALYRGPFLNGFYVEDAPEFERWTETERARLASRYADALRRLGDNAEKAGDVSACTAWRKRLVEADPLSSRYALAYMRALAAAGDRAAALQHAKVHDALVRQELECEPDPSIAAEVARLRADGGRVAPVAPTASAVDVPAPRPVEAPAAVDPTPAIASSAARKLVCRSGKPRGDEHGPAHDGGRRQAFSSSPRFSSSPGPSRRAVRRNHSLRTDSSSSPSPSLAATRPSRGCASASWIGCHRCSPAKAVHSASTPARP